MNTVRLSPEIEEKMRTLARQTGVTVSDIHRRAIEDYLARELGAGDADTLEKSGSRWDTVIGVVEGTKDGSAKVKQSAKEHATKKRSHATV